MIRVSLYSRMWLEGFRGKLHYSRYSFSYFRDRSNYSHIQYSARCASYNLARKRLEAKGYDVFEAGAFMYRIDERDDNCSHCGGHDFCVCNDVDFTEDSYDYPNEASYGRYYLEYCEDCQDFMEVPHAHIDRFSGHAEGW